LHCTTATCHPPPPPSPPPHFPSQLPFDTILVTLNNAATNPFFPFRATSIARGLASGRSIQQVALCAQCDIYLHMPHNSLPSRSSPSTAPGATLCRPAIQSVPLCSCRCRCFDEQPLESAAQKRFPVVLLCVWLCFANCSLHVTINWQAEARTACLEAAEPTFL
jgi:hypothetical protein